MSKAFFQSQCAVSKHLTSWQWLKARRLGLRQDDYFYGKVFIFSHTFHLRHYIQRLFVIPVGCASLTPMGTSEFKCCVKSLENSLPHRLLVAHATKCKHSILLLGKILPQNIRLQSVSRYCDLVLVRIHRYKAGMPEFQLLLSELQLCFIKAIKSI